MKCNEIDEKTKEYLKNKKPQNIKSQNIEEYVDKADKLEKKWLKMIEESMIKNEYD